MDGAGIQLSRSQPAANIVSTECLDDMKDSALLASVASIDISSTKRLSSDEVLWTAHRVLGQDDASVYLRALAARVLAISIVTDPSLRSHLDQESLLPQLVELVRALRSIKKRNADTNRATVNCCLAVALLMQTTDRYSYTSTMPIAFDSDILVMPEKPIELGSEQLHLTASRLLQRRLEPPSAVQEPQPVIQRTRSVVQRPKPVVQKPLLVKSRKLPAKRKPRINNWIEQEEIQEKEERKKQPTKETEVNSFQDVDENPRFLPTPHRVFQFDRYRVITPMFVKPEGYQPTRLTPLHVVSPGGEQERASRMTVSPLELAESNMESNNAQEATSMSTLDDIEANTFDFSASRLHSASEALLGAKEMLHLLEQKEMPISSHRRIFQEGTPDREWLRKRPHSPTRTKRMPWSVWRDSFQEYPEAVEDDPNDPMAISTSYKAVPSRELKTTSPRSPSSRILSSFSQDNRHAFELETPAEKRMRLKTILSLPSNRSNTANPSIDSYASELAQLKVEEARLRQEMKDTMQAQADHLPLRYLFKLPGGAAYCRHRMQRAISRWILAFEDDQKRLALSQWKACVEHLRYQERGRLYRRLAGGKRVKASLELILHRQLQQGFLKWVDSAQLAIWESRDSAVRTIQTSARRLFGLHRFLQMHAKGTFLNPHFADMYLAPERQVQFQIPVSVRIARRKVWYACVNVQQQYRWIRWKRYWHMHRQAAIKMQAGIRMRIQRMKYLQVRRDFIKLQAVYRMHLKYIVYHVLREATILLQRNFRFVRVRRLKRLIQLMQWREHQKQLTATILLQRIARGFLGRIAARLMYKERQEEHYAALLVQRCWYRRNNEWSTFLLLGCLREKGNEEDAFDRGVRVFTIHHAAKKIQRQYQIYITTKKNAAAILMQKHFRRCIAVMIVCQKRLELMSMRKMKWCLHFALIRRNVHAKKIQFAWLRAGGRMYHHLHHKRLVLVEAKVKAMYHRLYDAATVMQAIVRGKFGRIIARRERSARKLQFTIRKFLYWKHVRAEVARRRHCFAERTSRECINAGMKSAVYKIVLMRRNAATQIQRIARGVLNRMRMVSATIAQERRVMMVCRIQTLWRASGSYRLARKMMETHKRKEKNPYLNCTSVANVLSAMLSSAHKYFDPMDELSGMALSAWSQQLGIHAAYFHFFENDEELAHRGPAKALEFLRSMQQDDCRHKVMQLGVDKGDLELIMTNLYAKQTLDEVKEAKKNVKHHIQVFSTFEKAQANARYQLEALIQRRDQCQETHDDMALESRDFQNLPLGLRRRKEKIIEELQELQSRIQKGKSHLDSCVSKCEMQQKRVDELRRHVRDALEPREESANHSLKYFKLIESVDVARELFLAKFPRLEARAQTFAKSLEEVRVSRFQLVRFFQECDTISEVKQKFSMLTNAKCTSEVDRFNYKRFHACADTLQYGWERIADLLNVSFDMAVDPRAYMRCGYLERCAMDAINMIFTSKTGYDKTVEWLGFAEDISKLNRSIETFQAIYRGVHTRKHYSINKSQEKRNRVIGEYLEDFHFDRVTPLWQADRRKEEQELEEWYKENEKEERKRHLYQTLRYLYSEEWNDLVQRYVYSKWDGKEWTETHYERPVYTIEEEDAVIVIQAHCRRFLAQRVTEQRRREMHKWRKREVYRQSWEAKQKERERLVTMDISLDAKVNERKEMADKQRSVNKKPSTVGLRASTKDNVQIKGWETWRSGWEQQIQSSYHASVLSRHRRNMVFPAPARQPNVHASAIMSLLNDADDFRTTFAPTISATITIRHTKAVLRFGWQEVSNGDSPYYVDTLTLDTSWSPSYYEFDEEYATLKVQSIARCLLARMNRSQLLWSIDLVGEVKSMLEESSRVGWIGFGLEGVNTQAMLTRMGLARHAPNLAKRSVVEVLKIPSMKLSQKGWTPEEIKVLGDIPQAIQRKYPQSQEQIDLDPALSHPYNILPSTRYVQQVVTKQYPNQQGRVKGLLSAITSSSTPISYRQLQTFLRKYGGRPDDAVNNIMEIASLSYMTQKSQERQILKMYTICTARMISLVANYRIETLRHHLCAVLITAKGLEDCVGEVDECVIKIADSLPMVSIPNEELQTYRQKALDRYPAKCVKGLWEHRIDMTFPIFSYAQLAFYLREESIEYMLLCISCVMSVQATYRMHRVRIWYQSVVAWRRAAAIIVQCAWRVIRAYRQKTLLAYQIWSQYEQRLDKETKQFYYIHIPTEERTESEPHDLEGNMIPYRPMVRDRLTKRWIRAWPDFEPWKQKSNDQDDVQHQYPCTICQEISAVRRCDECYGQNGDYVDFCLACFFDAHMQLEWHSYHLLTNQRVRYFSCIECKRLSCQRCLQCDEHYCSRCFHRVHGKGHRRQAHVCEFYAPMAAVCIECESRIAIEYCTVCSDFLCAECAKLTHKRGALQNHTRQPVPQPLDSPEEVHCNQCQARKADTKCEHCRISFCQICKQEKHVTVCLETKLEQLLQQLFADRLCVECGKIADRKCVECGDQYCSVRWMGNPGCFENFHNKGRRFGHAAIPFEKAVEIPKEVQKLEELVRQKRKEDAKMESAKLTQASDYPAKKKKLKKPKKRSKVCTAKNCSEASLKPSVPFCLKHFTLQNALSVANGDHTEAARLLLDAKLGRLRAQPSLWSRMEQRVPVLKRLRGRKSILGTIREKLAEKL